MNFDACVQSLINLKKVVNKSDIEQNIKKVLENIDTLLKITEFSGEMGIVYNDTKIAWSDLIAKKNAVCHDDTNKACQLVRRLIMFAIRGTKIDNDGIIVPGRNGKENIVSNKILGVESNINGFCSDNIFSVDSSLDFLKLLNKALSLRRAWDEGHEKAFQSKASMPLVKFHKSDDFDRLEADVSSKQLWNDVRLHLISLIDSILGTQNIIDKISEKKGEIIKILNRSFILFDIPLKEKWEQIASAGVKQELGKLLNRCVSISKIINIANMVQIALLTIIDVIENFWANEALRTEMELRHGVGKAKSKDAGETLSMPVSSHKDHVARQRELQRELHRESQKNVAQKDASSMNTSDEIPPPQDNLSAKTKKKKKKKKAGDEKDDDDKLLNDAIRRNQADRIHTLQQKIDKNEFIDVHASDVENLVTQLSDQDTNKNLQAVNLLHHISVQQSTQYINESIISAGAIHPLVKLLGNNNIFKADIAGLLVKLSSTAEIKEIIANEGAIEFLVDILRKNNTIYEKQKTLELISNLIFKNPHNKEIMIRAGGIQVVVLLLTNPDPKIKDFIVKILSYLINENADAKVAVVNLNVIPELIALLHTAVKLEKIPNIAQSIISLLWYMSLEKEDRILITSRGAIEILLMYLRRKDISTDVLLQVVGVLSNLSIDEVNKKFLTEAVELLVPLLTKVNVKIRQYTVKTLYNLSAHSNKDNAEYISSRLAMVRAGAIQPLVRLLHDRNITPKSNLAGLLWNLSIDKEHKVMVANAGAIQPLVNLLREGNTREVTEALGALSSLTSENADNQNAMLNMGIIELLVPLLSDAESKKRQWACTLLYRLSVMNENRAAIVRAGAIQPLVRLFHDRNITPKSNLAGLLWNLSIDKEHKVMVANAGAIQPLVNLLREGNTREVTEALGALSSLTSENADNQNAMLNMGIIELLVPLLSDAESKKRQWACTLLYRLSVMNENRAAIVRAGAIQPLVRLFHDRNITPKSNLAGLLWNLSIDKEHKVMVANAGAIQPLVNLLREGNTREVTEALGALSSLIDNKDNKNTVANLGIIELLVPLLSNADSKIKYKASTILYKLSINVNNNVSAVSAEVIQPLVGLLRDGTKTSKVDVLGLLWILSTTLENKVRIVNAGVLEALVSLLHEGNTQEVIQALGVLSSLVTDNPDNKNTVANLGAIQLLELLSNNADDIIRESAGILLHKFN